MPTSLRAACALAVLSLSFSASAQFEGVADARVTSREDGNRMEAKGRLYISPRGWRMELEWTAVEPAKGSPAAAAMAGMVGQRMIAFGKESEPGKTWMLNEPAKTYSVMEDDDDEGREEEEEGEGWKITRLGADKVAGLSCTSVRAERPDDDEIHEACLAKEMATASWMKGMKESDSDGWFLAAERAGIAGYPVRMITRTRAGAERERFELTQVERKKLPASIFEVPKGYREASLMENLTATPEQQEAMKRQMEEAMKSMDPEQRKALEELMKKSGGK